MPSKGYLLRDIQKKMEHYCAYQERCHQEVILKLRSMNAIPEVIDIVVTNLITNNFLNEERFAKNFTRGKFNQKKWGRIKIKQELKSRKISPYIINSALREIEDDYINTFHLLLERLHKVSSEKNQNKKRNKLINKLLYRGWEKELIYDAVYNLLSKNTSHDKIKYSSKDDPK